MGSNAKILLVDDDTLVLSAFRRLFELAGYEVSTAVSGEEAVRVAGAQSPDLVLLDRMLPDMDGIEVCRRIKQEPKLSHCLVVILSGTRISSAEQADGLEGGADGYISKSISNRELLARVEALLRIQRAEARTNRLNHILRTIRQIDRLVVQEDDRDRLVQRICENLTEMRGYQEAWIVLLDRKGKVESIAKSGPNTIFSSLQAQQAGGGDLPGCVRQALTQPETLIVRCSAEVCHPCSLDGLCTPAEMIWIRLEYQTRIYGLLGVAVPAWFTVDEEERFLLFDITQDVSMALRRLELEVERKRDEHALRQSEHKFRSFVEQSYDGVMLTDEQGGVVEWNRAMQQLTGLDAAQVLGRPIWDVQFELSQDRKMPEQRLHIEAVFREMLHTGYVPFGQVVAREYRHPDGDHRYVEESIFTIETDGGFMLGGISRDVTARVQIEGQLRDREAFLTTLLQAIPIPVFYKDRAGRYQGFNVAFEHFFGRSQEEMIGKTVFDLHPPDLANIYYAQDNKLFEQGGLQRYETQVVDAGGVLHDVILEKAVFFDHQGEIGGLVGAVLDITEHKRSEMLLRSIVDGTASVVGEAFFRVLVRYLAAALQARYALIGTLSADGKSVQTLAVWTGEGYAENFVYELAGTPCEQVIGISECYYPQGVQSLFPRDRLLVEMGIESYRGFPLCDKVGNPLGIIAVLNDRPMVENEQAESIIRIFAARAVAELERMRIEASLQASEMWFRSLLESAPDSIVISDSNGRIVLVNVQTEALFGYPRDQLIGRPIDLLLPPHLVQKHRTHCRNYLAHPMTRPMGSGLDLHARHADGHEFPVEINLSPVHTPDGVQVIGVIRDMSVRKQVESMLHLQSAALESAANAIVITDREGLITWANPAFTRLTGYTLEEVRGKNPRLLKSGRQEADFYRNLWQTILSGQVWQGELVNRRRDGTQYIEEMTITPVKDDRGHISHFVAIKQDVTARKEMQQMLVDELRVSNALSELAKMLLSAMSFEDIPSLVLERALELTGSEFGFVGYIDPHSGNLISPTLTRGMWERCQVPRKCFEFDRFTGLWGWVLNNRQPLLTNEPMNDPRSTGVPEGHPPIRRFIAVPALIEDELVGEIALANAAHDYSARDLQILERLATLYALSIQRQRFQGRQEELTFYLNERVKELSCLYSISSLAGRQNLSLDEILSQVVELIPSAMREPENVCARILLDGRRFATANFRETPWKVERHIFVGSEPVGSLQVFYLGTKQANREILIKEEQDLLTAVVERLGETAERKRAEMRLRQYAEEQSALYAITSVASAFLEPERLLSAVLDVLLALLGADAGWVLMSGATTQDPPRMVVSRGLTPEFQAAEVATSLLTCSICGPLLSPNARSHRSMLMAKCPRLPAEVLAGVGLYDHVGIPLYAGGHVLGILNVGWQKPHDHSAVQQRLLDTLGQQIGLALRNAQLYQAALQVNRLEVLNAVSAAAVSSLDLHTVLHETLRLTCQALGATEGSILQRNPDTDELIFITTLSESSSMLRGYILPPGQGIAGWVIKHRQSVCTNEVYTDERFYKAIDELTGVVTHSLMCVPLVYQDQIIGIVEVTNKRDGGFTRDDLSLLEAVASIVASAMANARLYQMTVSRANELTVLNEIGMNITATLDREKIFADALTHIQRLFPADGVVMRCTNSQHDEPYLVRARLGGDTIATLELPQIDTFSRLAVDRREAVLVTDVQNDPRWPAGRPYDLDPYLGSGVRGMMVVPLLTPARAIGVIQVVSRQPGTFTIDSLRILQAISTTVSIALENARLYEELKSLLWERERAQARLIHTEKMSALGRLAASLAHEINNPLQSVIGCLDLSLEELETDDTVRQYLQVARTEVERVARTMTQMRHLYRRSSTEREYVEVNDLVEQVIELTRKRCQEANVQVSWMPAPYLPMMMLSADEIRQVFLNLLLNALEAMPGGGKLTIRTILTQEPAGVRIEFTDTGIGIPPDVMQHLFEPFYSTKPEGTGLGLSISSDIVERHGGQIAVESQVGEGSTFTIWLPEEADRLEPEKSQDK